MTICTIDVHARDVVAKMIAAKAWGPRGPGTGWELVFGDSSPR